MFHKIALVGIALLALCCVGCFDYAEQMVINEDGSGTIQMRISMDKTYFQAMKKMATDMAVSMGGDTSGISSSPELFSREEIEKSLAKEEPGAKLISFDTSETEQAKVWDIKFSFDNINKVEGAMSAMQAEEGEASHGGDSTEAATEESPISFTRQADGTWLFSRRLGGGTGLAGLSNAYKEAESEEESGEAESETPAETTGVDTAGVDSLGGEQGSEAQGLDEMDEGIKALMGNLGNHTFKMSVTFPGKVIESNATSVNGNTAVWEYKLSELGNAADSLRAVIKK